MQACLWFRSPVLGKKDVGIMGYKESPHFDGEELCAAPKSLSSEKRFFSSFTRCQVSSFGESANIPITPHCPPP